MLKRIPKRFWVLFTLLLVMALPTAAVGSGLVTSDQIQDRTVRAQDMATGSVNSRVLKNGSVKSPDLSAGVRGALKAKAVPGPKGDKGDTGAAGATGSQGLQGIQGLLGLKGDKGDKGDTGAQGPAGPEGAQGSAGPEGAPGSTGPKGDKGDQGNPGAPGTDGTNNPLVFGPYAYTGTDGGNCGNRWADTAGGRTYIATPQPDDPATPQPDDSVGIVILWEGTFVTRAGDSPNPPAGTCGTPAAAVAAGISGTFYGNYVITVPGEPDFNFTATCPGSCTPDQFFTAFFGKPEGWYKKQPLSWQFYFDTPSNGSWYENDDPGIGNIQ